MAESRNLEAKDVLSERHRTASIVTPRFATLHIEFARSAVGDWYIDIIAFCV